LIQKNNIVPNFLNGIYLLGNNHEVDGNTIANPSPGQATVGVIASGENNIIKNNHIGVVPDSDEKVWNSVGVWITGNKNQIFSNVIGNTKVQGQITGDDDLLGTGVYIWGNENEIWDNYIGTDKTGTQYFGNDKHGILVEGNKNCIGGKIVGGICSLNEIVGFEADDFYKLPEDKIEYGGNYIFGNKGFGIKISHGSENVIINNQIGKVEGENYQQNHKGGILIESDFNYVRDFNLIKSNFDFGIKISGNSNIVGSHNIIESHVGPGIMLLDGASKNQILDNKILDNHAGVKVDGPTTINNKISSNSISENYFKDHKGLGIVLENGGNNGIKPPGLDYAGPHPTNPVDYVEIPPNTAYIDFINGTACAGCDVEIFSDPKDQGKIYEGTAVADQNGYFQFTKEF